ncbi:MAG: type I 3-dehydroquinate dehydratase, partial [Deltaproteobacteria bacterium]|nr:type I 3-dehydroquinate dehydratase [Deltaproteobacteria bacterium]
MLCVTGNEKTLPALVERIERAPEVDLHEVRLDLLDALPSDVCRRLPAREKLIVTVRPRREGGGWDGAEEKRVRRLREALAAGVGWIDVEASTPAPLLDELLAAPGSTRRIVSAHPAEGDPETPLAALARLGAHRAHVLKLALPIADAADLVALRDAAAATRRQVVAIGMGPAGTLSRLAYRAFGSEWTYVAAGEASRTAPGQWTLAEARRVGLERQTPRVYGLLGGPNALRSPGPRVYNALLPRSGQPLAYVALPTSRPGPVLELLRAELLAGLSVTMPHKETVRDLL